MVTNQQRRYSVTSRWRQGRVQCPGARPVVVARVKLDFSSAGSKCNENPDKSSLLLHQPLCDANMLNETSVYIQ